MLVDDREARTNRQVYQSLTQSLDDVERMRLSYGDYAFFGARVEGRVLYVGIETCTVSDLIGKIQTGRFQAQLTGCINNYDVVILLIEGQIQPTADGRVAVYTHSRPTGLPYETVRGALFAAKAHGIIVEEVKANKTAVADKLLKIHNYYSRDNHTLFQGVKRQPVTFRPGVHMDRAVAALMQMAQGIGKDRAEAALEHFGSLEAVMNADTKQLQEVPGWGKTLAYNLRQTAAEQKHTAKAAE